MGQQDRLDGRHVEPEEATCRGNAGPVPGKTTVDESQRRTIAHQVAVDPPGSDPVDLASHLARPKLRSHPITPDTGPIRVIFAPLAVRLFEWE
jgi:hypothetical protein